MAVINDLSYDVLTALQSKLEALEAYDVFIQDSQEAGDDETRRLFESLRQADERHAGELRDRLEALMKAGKFR